MVVLARCRESESQSLVPSLLGIGSRASSARFWEKPAHLRSLGKGNRAGRAKPSRGTSAPVILTISISGEGAWKCRIHGQARCRYGSREVVDVASLRIVNV